MVSIQQIKELNNCEFDGFIKNGMVLIDFFAEWCMPSIMMEPIFDDLNEKFNGKIIFGRMNIEENRAIKEKLEITSIPCTVLFKDGKIVEKIIGTVQIDEIEEQLKNYL